MLDAFHIPNSKVDIQIFSHSHAQSGSYGPPQVWRKPKGCSFAYMLAISGGSSGGGGFAGASGAGGGGGGGGSGSVFSTFFPLWLFPEILYIWVPSPAPIGSAGGTVSVSTTLTYNGATSLVSMNGGAFPTGVTGTATAGGTGVGSISGFGVTSGYFSYLTNPFGTASFGNSPSTFSTQGGANGGFNSVGVSRSLPTVGGAFITGGAGGGGAATTGSNGFDGGGITALTQPTPIITPSGGAGATSATGNGTNGVSGIQTYTPGQLLYFTGGTGGGSGGGTSGNGGNGGDGGIGCGGGGGGGCRTGSTPGLGGRGGPGLVIIAAW